MITKPKLYFYIFLLALYLIVMLPILYLSILLIGRADNSVIIIYGIINSLFFRKHLKGNTLLSIFLGFFISSFSLCLVYLIWYMGLFTNPNFGLLFYIISSIIIWFAITQKGLEIRNHKMAIFKIFLPTLLFVIIAFNLKTIYPKRFENKNLILTEIKIVDKQKKPKAGDSIEVRVERHPLFGLKESHEIYKTITDEKGSTRLKLSKSNNYQLDITTKENNLKFFDIDSTDLKSKNLFIIEVE